MKNLEKCDGCGTLRRRFERWLYVYPDIAPKREPRELVPSFVFCKPCGDQYERAERELAGGGGG